MDEILEPIPSEYYIRECEERKFIFILEGSKEILESDIPITEEDHKQFLKSQSEGKQFRLKELPIGEGLFEYIEEYIPEIIPVDPLPNETEIFKERVNSLEKENADLLKDSAIKDTKIENLQNDIADIMKEMAGGI